MGNARRLAFRKDLAYQHRRASESLLFPECGQTCALLTKSKCDVLDVECTCFDTSYWRALVACASEGCTVLDQDKIDLQAYYRETCLGVIGESRPEPLLFLEEQAKKSQRFGKGNRQQQLDLRQNSFDGGFSTSDFGLPVGTTATAASSTFHTQSTSNTPTTATSLSSPATNSSEPLPLPQPSSSSKKGLSGGAIAGIVVGIVVILAIISVLAFLYRRRRGAAQPNEPQLPELSGTTSRHEMQTAANTHELSGKGDGSKVANSSLPYMQTRDGALVIYGRYGSPQYELENNPAAVAITASELSSDSIVSPKRPSSGTLAVERDPAEAQLPAPDAATPSSSTGSASKLDELKQRMEKIRSEKERLLKVQELEEMEAAVQKEIMEEQSKNIMDQQTKKMDRDL